MAGKARIFAGVFLFCIILPSLASAFKDHLPEVTLSHDSDESDVSIHVSNVAHLSDEQIEELKEKAGKENDKGENIFNADLAQESQDGKTNAAPEGESETVTPTPDSVPVNATPKNMPAGYPGANLPPVTVGYGAIRQAANQSGTDTPVPEQPIPGQKHPSAKEIKKHRKKAGLEVGYYEDTCPNAEKIIKEGLIKAFTNDSTIAAAFPRLLLHDCFVKGCDASIFLDQTPSGGKIEKLANSNGPSVRGFELVDEIKAQLEGECPGIVSCADILAYLSRDAFVVSGVPHYDVPGGRRDGMESLESNAIGNLPLPDSPVDMLIDLFKRKGLNEEDLAVLLGAHSIGVAHCFSFLYRLDNPQKAAIIDPRLSAVMRFTCTSQMSTLPFDTTTQYKMDSNYYKQLEAKRGLLESDALLSEDRRIKDYIHKFGDDQSEWLNKLGKAMNKLAATEVLTGEQGQIRKHCRAVN